MKKPVYLVNVAWKINQVQLPIAFSVLVNTLKRHEIETHLLDMIPVVPENRVEVFKDMIPSEPSIYGFSLIVGNNHIGETEKYVKIIMEKNPENTIVYGGPLPSAIPGMLLEKSFCDYVVAGEGEVTFPGLIQSIYEGNPYPEDIPGLYFRNADGNIHGSPNKWIRKLDLLSEPDYSLFDMDYYIDYLKQTDQSFELMASRGCRGDCSFCYKFCGNGLSMRSVDSVLDEIAFIRDTYGVNKFYFVDENFLDVRKYFLDFVKKKRERAMDFQFIAQVRMDGIDEEICQLGVENGLICLSSGIESASQSTLDKVDKRIKVKDIEGKLKLTEKHNIKHLVSFILGFPWDTEEDYEHLFEFVKRNKLEKRYKLHYLTPLPKTRLYNYALENGYIKDEYEYIKTLGDLYWERMINLTQFTDEVFDAHYGRLFHIGKKDVTYPKDEKYLATIKEIH